MEALREAIERPGTTFSALDPCAGKGEALAQFMDGSHGTTYGIELDHLRAREAGERLDHVLNTSLFNTFIEDKAVSLLFLNPPYDDADGRRLEYRFLRRALPVLKPGGVLVYIVPEALLADYQVRILLHCRFKDVRAYRFPKGEYERFRQAFVIARLRMAPDWKQRDCVLEVKAFNDLSEDVERFGRWPIPYGKPLTTFACTEVSEEEVQSELESGPSARWLRDKLAGNFAQMERPLMPLKKGHIVQLLLGGFLDNTVIDLTDQGGIRKVAVKGFAQKHTETIEDKAKKQTIIREKVRCGVNILDLTTGHIEEMVF